MGLYIREYKELLNNLSRYDNDIVCMRADLVIRDVVWGFSISILFLFILFKTVDFSFLFLSLETYLHVKQDLLADMQWGNAGAGNRKDSNCSSRLTSHRLTVLSTLLLYLTPWRAAALHGEVYYPCSYPESMPPAQPHRATAPQPTDPLGLTCREEGNCCFFCLRWPVWGFGFLGGMDFTLPLSRNLK